MTTSRKTKPEWLMEGRARKAHWLSTILLKRGIPWEKALEMNEEQWRGIAAEATEAARSAGEKNAVGVPSQATVDRVARIMMGHEQRRPEVR